MPPEKTHKNTENEKRTLGSSLLEFGYRLKQKLVHASRKRAYCPHKQTISFAKSKGGLTGDPTVCSECGVSFGINDRRIKTEYKNHVNYSRLPSYIYRISYPIRKNMSRLFQKLSDSHTN